MRRTYFYLTFIALCTVISLSLVFTIHESGLLSERFIVRIDNGNNGAPISLHGLESNATGTEMDFGLHKDNQLSVIATSSSTSNSTSNSAFETISNDQSKQRKSYNLQNQTPPLTSGAFIHIGKTAGSTLSMLLRNGCHSHVPKPCMNDLELPPFRESHVSKLTTYYHIPDFESILQKNHKEHPYDFFVFTTRDPLERAISSFIYTHPITVAVEKVERFKRKNPSALYVVTMGVKDKNDMGSIVDHLINNTDYINERNKNMYSCFNTLESYAQLIHNSTYLPGNHGWETYFNKTQCDNVAKSTLHHIDPLPMIHQYWDLQNILLQIHDGLRNKTLFVTRQEFLWDDWKSTNRYLGDEGEIYIPETSKRKYDEMNIPEDKRVQKTLSESGRENLCRALEKEYRVYLRLLVLAENLSRRQVEESLEMARKNCPWLDLKLPNVDEIETVVMSRSRAQYDL